MSQIKLENDLKEMRERIIDMNSQLNKMLDRYELLAGTTQKKDVEIVNPHKFLSKQIEINQKLIEKQLQHIKQVAFSLVRFKKRISNSKKRTTWLNLQISSKPSRNRFMTWKKKSIVSKSMWIRSTNFSRKQNKCKKKVTSLKRSNSSSIRLCSTSKSITNKQPLNSN